MSAFTPITYIGKRAEYTDGAYGTYIKWSRGDTQLVPADKAKLMLKHPDVYELGQADADLTVPIIKAKTDDEDESQNLRDSINAMNKAALADFAKLHFNVEVDKTHKTAALRLQVTGLFDQYGLQ